MEKEIEDFLKNEIIDQILTNDIKNFIVVEDGLIKYKYEFDFIEHSVYHIAKLYKNLGTPKNYTEWTKLYKED